MKLPNAAPGEGRQSDRDHWNNWEVAGGQKHHAYYAGGTQWFVAHPSDKGTKPCLEWMTGGKLPCRWCHAAKVPQQIGYVPVFRAVDYRPLFVIVYQEEREWIEMLRLHDRVQVGRESERGARIWVRVCLDQTPAFTTTLARRMVEADITQSLLTLWKLPDLTAWLTTTSDNPVSIPLKAPETSKTQTTTIKIRDECEQYTGPLAGLAETEELYEVLKERIIERTKQNKPSANGKHKPKV